MKDPTDTRDIGPRVGSPLWIHLTSVTVVGAVVFALTLTRLMHLSLLIVHPLFWVLAAWSCSARSGRSSPLATPGLRRRWPR